MPVCITGMHRSGTSLIARLLQAHGLYLGDDADLLPAAADNPDGFWEHRRFIELDDVALSYLGGAWDFPPPFTGNEQGPQWNFLLERARVLVRDFKTHRHWGWKDPRSSLVMPLWLQAAPDLKVIVVVRNPLEVAESLHRRNGSSYALGLGLWTAYNERLLETVPSTRRIVTHYNSHFTSPAAELRRLVTFLDLPFADETVEGTSLIEGSLRHTHYSARDLEHAAVSPQVRDLYARLCDLAEWTEDISSVPEQASPVGDPIRDGEAINCVREGDAENGSPTTGTTRLTVGQLDRGFLQEDTIRDLQQLLEDRTEWAQRSAQEVRLRDDTIEGLRSRLADQTERLDRVLGAFDELAALIADVRPDVPSIRRAIRGAVQEGKTVLVASKGDDDLLKVATVRAMHFPQDERGGYAGYHPADSDGLLAHLDDLWTQGAEYLVLPHTTFWWLEAYPGLNDYIQNGAERVWSDGQCLIVRLVRGPRKMGAS